MELYFSPLACSMATRIALYEAGAAARFVYVDGKSKRLADGSNYLAVNPMGQVPALRTEEGEILTENPVVLQYVADQYPDSGLAPPAGRNERYKLQRWLNFVTSELHKLVFTPLLSPAAPEGAKAFARDKAELRFKVLDDYLEEAEFLLDRFTIADCYLATVLNWAGFAGIDLAKFPHVQAYFQRLQKRPSVAKAMAEELALYKEEQARRQAA
ncbi:MAG TPA: glutathione binding-like protein [Alphaproteobacteria bacterium]|nr:glutathione binding-like protein [Alphaproteobacteria bacterium]